LNLIKFDQILFDLFLFYSFFRAFLHSVAAAMPREYSEEHQMHLTRLLDAV
jgi:hypothetical protein